MYSGQKKSPSLLGTALFLLLAIAGALFFLKYGQKSLENRAQALQKAVDFIKSDYEFARIRVLKKTESDIRFRLSLIDIEGRVVASRTLTFKGGDPFIESRVVLAHSPEAPKAFVFPYRAYSDRIAPSEGVLLGPLYIKDGFPLTYRRKQANAMWKKTLSGLYRTAIKNDNYFNNSGREYIDNIFSASIHLGIMGDWKTGRDYGLFIHPNGGIELREEDK